MAQVYTMQAAHDTRWKQCHVLKSEMMQSVNLTYE